LKAGASETHVQPDRISLHLQLSRIRSFGHDVVQPVDEESSRVGDAVGVISFISIGSRRSEQMSGEAYKGKDIVKAKEIPRRTSNATAAMFKNCKYDQSQYSDSRVGFEGKSGTYS
jgi:hypothetical protein